jgi:serine protease AprX
MNNHPQVGWRSWHSAMAAVAAAALAIPLLTTAPVSASQDDASPVPQYLLSVPGGELGSVADAVAASGGSVVAEYGVASAILVQMPRDAVVPAGAVVVPDLPMEFQGTEESDELPTNTYRETTAVPDGVDGSGVTVALVDTGVADTGELSVQHVNVSGDADGDGLGHGTFLAGLIAGNGAASDGDYAGAAPGASILDVQVADAQGTTSLSKVLAGLQEVSDRARDDSNLKVVNLALSTGSPLPPWFDPLTRGLDSLWGQGLTVVVASGNDGKNAVSSPASDPLLLAVGSVDENDTAKRQDDRVADFSAYDRTFGTSRPDVVAPGVSLVSLRALGSIADNENPSARVQDKYFKGTGTSMSAALTSGLVAGLLSERAALTPDEVKRVVMDSAYDTGKLKRRKGAGAGGVDLAKAISTDVADTKPLKYKTSKADGGPSEADTQAWANFGAAWESGDLKAAVQAWRAMSPQTRRWAADAWSLAVLMRALTMEEGDFEGRRWAGRRWATQDWEGRRWATDDWVGRRWAKVNWDGRRWAEDNWEGRRWAGRRWASDDWLAFAWTLRSDPDSSKIKSEWADDEWEGRRWAGRRWASDDWAGRRWAADAWDGRRWADYQWDGRRWAGRRWASDSWDGRRWADLAWEGRRWANENWTGRRWAVTLWGS